MLLLSLTDVFDSTNIKEILFRYDAWMAKHSWGQIDTLLENYTYLEVNQFSNFQILKTSKLVQGIIWQLAAGEDKSRAAHIFN